MRIRAWWLSLVAVTAAAAAPDDGGAALRSYFAGNGFLARGMYESAIEEYRDFLAAHADHERAPDARYGLAVGLYRLGDHRGAVAALQELDAPAGFQFAAESLAILGQSRLALGEPGAAADAFDRLRREHGGHDLADEAEALLAESFHKAGRYEAVEGPCRRLAEAHPDSPHRARADLFLGLARIARGEHEAAAEVLEALARRDPDGPYADRAGLLAAQSLDRAGRWRRATARYRQVLQRAAGDLATDAAYGLARLLHADGRLDEAAALLDELPQRGAAGDTARAARLLRARIRFDRGDYDAALRAFEGLAGEAGGPHRDEAAWWAGKCLLRQERPGAAAARLEAALRRFPDGLLAGAMTYDRAVALVRADRGAEALPLLERFDGALAGHELAPDALALRAATLLAAGRYRESLDCCRRFRQRFGDRGPAAEVELTALESLYLLGDHDAAAEEARAWLARHDDHEGALEARFRLGLAEFQRQRYETAQRHLAEVADGRDTEPRYRPALLALGDAAFQQRRWAEAERALEAYLDFGLDQPSTDDALLKLGLARLRRGRPSEALPPLRTLIDDLPASPLRPRALFEAGQCLMELDRDAEAEPLLRQVAAGGADEPFAADAMSHLGALALADERAADAAGWFGRAAEALDDPSRRADALRQRGEALVAAGQFEQAVEALDRLAREHPDRRDASAAALRAIALARVPAPDHETALRAIRAAQSGAGALDPSLRAALGYEAAWCLRELGRTEEAVAAYRSVLDRGDGGEPGGVRDHATLELAGLEYDAQRYDEAAALLRALAGRLEAAGATTSLRRRCDYRLGLCEFRLGRHDAAAQRLEAYLAGDPETELAASARLVCAESHMAAGRYGRAAGHLERVVADHPDDDACGPALLRLGECRAALQEWGRSRAAFETYLSRFAQGQRWFEARFGIGWALENEGRYEDALEHYGRVVEAHRGETAARAQFQIGECLFALGRHAAAAKALVKVDILYAYPQWSAAALYEAGRAFQEAGSPVEARRQYRQVRRDHPESRWAAMAAARLEELSRSGLPGHDDAKKEPSP